MDVPSSDSLRERQIHREEAQRAAALGRRAQGIANGELGPVLKRWVNASIGPVAARLRGVAGGGLRPQEAMGSEIFGLPSGDPSKSRDLAPVLKWCLKGSSAGRASGAAETTYADDLVLAVLGSAISMLAASPEKGVGLSTVLLRSGEAARETCLGQFITQVQGAKAMMAVRQGGKAGWAQGKELDTIAALMAGQVRSALGGRAAGEGVRVGGRAVVEVLTHKGATRRLDLRPPSIDDWALLNVARQVKGEADKHDGTWRSFAMMVLCAAQAEADLFQMAKAPVRSTKRGQGRHWRHLLCLSEALGAAIRGDLDRWVRLGFIQSPMICEPENGDYLTVKHRPIAGRRGPMGIRTEAEGTAAWEVASKVMAGSAWEVSKETLAFLRTDLGRELAGKSEERPERLEMILGEAARVASEDTPLYFPIQMDFRGRVYLRPQMVTYQGSDVQKGLLRFANEGASLRDETPEEFAAWCNHAANLYGHGAEKLPLGIDRMMWWADVSAGEGPADMALEAEEPVQLYNHMLARQDNAACQIDGTCNGLQHLTALFRDEKAAPYVNLVGAAQKADVYATVASRVAEILGGLDAAWARRIRASIKIDRKLTKRSVMVLPYGGTRGTIDECTLDAVVAQMDAEPFLAALPNGLRACPWRECLVPSGVEYDMRPLWGRDTEAAGDNYLAFKDRELKHHPLLRLDCQRLGGLIWAAIHEILPKPMLAMQAFRTIAAAVGDRTLEWSTGFQIGSPINVAQHGKGYWSPLRVIQAKAVSESQGLRLKGFHLPGTVRGLAMKVGRDEVDPKAHVSGIVANLIHSLDATHLARTMYGFQYGGETRRAMAFGAIHDCFITRPSLMESLAFHTREAFVEMYAEADPLGQPVWVTSLDALKVQAAYPSWYALAEACGASFPERGTEWEPSEVLGSQWFFS